jgi:hypothetical protein
MQISIKILNFRYHFLSVMFEDIHVQNSWMKIWPENVLAETGLHRMDTCENL